MASAGVVRTAEAAGESIALDGVGWSTLADWRRRQ